MGLRVAFILFGILAAGLPASAQGLRVPQPVAVTAAPKAAAAAPRVVHRRVPVQPATQTYPTAVFPMAVAPSPARMIVVRHPRSRASVKAAKGAEGAQADVQADAPKSDASKADAPKADSSKADSSKADAPKADAPKADAQK